MSETSPKNRQNVSLASTFNRTQSRSANYRKAVPSFENLPGAAGPAPAATKSGGRTIWPPVLSRSISIETSSTFASSAAAQHQTGLSDFDLQRTTRDGSVPNGMLQDHEEYVPHTALTPPPRPKRQVIFPRRQDLSRETSSETLASTAVSIPVAHVSSLLQQPSQELLPSVPTSTAVHEPVPKYPSFEPFGKSNDEPPGKPYSELVGKTVNMEIMGPTAQSAYERRKPHFPRMTPPTAREPAPKSSAPGPGQRIMDPAEIHKKLAEPNTNKIARNPHRPLVESESRGTLPAGVQPSGLKDLLSMPKTRTQTYVTPPAPVQPCQNPPPRNAPDPGEIQRRDSFVNSVSPTPLSCIGSEQSAHESESEGPSRRDVSEIPSSQARPPPSGRILPVATAVHHALPGNPDIARALSKNKSEWSDWTKGRRITESPGSLPTDSEPASRVASHSDSVNDQSNRRGKPLIPQATGAGTFWSKLFYLFWCCAEPDSDVDDYPGAQPRSRRHSMTPSARFSLQVGGAWSEIELPTRNMPDGPRRTQ